MAWDLNIYKLTDSDEWHTWLVMDLEEEKWDQGQGDLWELKVVEAWR